MRLLSENPDRQMIYRHLTLHIVLWLIFIIISEQFSIDKKLHYTGFRLNSIVLSSNDLEQKVKRRVNEIIEFYRIKFQRNYEILKKEITVSNYKDPESKENIAQFIEDISNLGINSKNKYNGFHTKRSSLWKNKKSIYDTNDINQENINAQETIFFSLYNSLRTLLEQEIMKNKKSIPYKEYQRKIIDLFTIRN